MQHVSVGQKRKDITYRCRRLSALPQFLLSLAQGELEGSNVAAIMPPPFSQQHDSYLVWQLGAVGQGKGGSQRARREYEQLAGGQQQSKPCSSSPLALPQHNYMSTRVPRVLDRVREVVALVSVASARV